jgi:hypothetical protein
LSGISVFAQNTEPDPSSLEIVPKVDQGTLWSINSAIQDPNNSKHVWDIYNDQASWLNTAEQIASGVMDRDTILDYGVYILQFLSQAWLLVGALMFIYTGYKYIMSVITGDWAPDKKLIQNAIYGILIIIFSYAIMRILTRAFLT